MESSSRSHIIWPWEWADVSVLAIEGGLVSVSWKSLQSKDFLTHTHAHACSLSDISGLTLNSLSNRTFLSALISVPIRRPVNSFLPPTSSKIPHTHFHHRGAGRSFVSRRLSRTHLMKAWPQKLSPPLSYRSENPKTPKPQKPQSTSPMFLDAPLRFLELRDSGNQIADQGFDFFCNCWRETSGKKV